MSDVRKWDNAKIGSMIAELSALGEFTLRKMNHGGWYSDLEFPSPEGCTAQCRSGFKHESPIEAMQCLIDRLGGLRDMVSVPSPVPGISHKVLS